MDACSCGRVPDPGDRFCSGCGTRVVATTVAAGTTGEARTSDRVRLAAYGMAAVVVMLVGLLLWPSGPSDEDQATSRSADDQAAAENQADGDPDGQDPATATDPARVLDQAGEDTAGEDSATAERAAGSEQPGPVGDGPVVGERTGLGLIIGQRPFTTMRLLDLDTGLVHQLAAQGEPVGVIGSTLVFRRDERVLTADLDTAEDPGTGLANGTGGWVEITSITDNRLWATPEGRTMPGGRVLVGFDDAGVPVDEVVVPRGYTTFGQDPEAELIQNAGGIYRRTGDGFLRVSEATLLLAGERLVLVEECDDAMVCRQRWYERSTWSEPVDLPIPDLPSQGWGTITGDDRWIVIMDRVAGSLQLHDLTEGRPVRTLGQSGPAGSGGVALSSDGRWLVEQAEDRFELVDLNDGTQWLYADQSVDPGAVVVFVELDRVGFLDP